MTRTTSRRRPGSSRLLATATALALGASGLAATVATADTALAAEDGLVVHYPLDETSGSTVHDASGNGKDAVIVNNTGTAAWQNGRGLRLPGGSSTNLNAFPAVKLPDALLAGLSDVTIAYDVLASGTAAGGPVAAFGQNSDNGGYLVSSPGDNNSTTVRHQAAIAGPGTPAQTAAGPAGLARNVWKHVAVTVKGGSASAPGELRVYEDGALVGINSGLTLKPADITSPTSYIGRSNVTSGTVRQFAGTVKDFRVYSAALAPARVQELSAATAPGNLQEILAGVTLGDTSAVREHLVLPTAPGLTWTSSNPAAVTATGRVTRPAADAADASATLTATVTHRGLTGTKDFPVTVKKRAALTEQELTAGLVHRFKLDETSGTVLHNSGSAGSAADATLVNPQKAELTGDGVRFNPSSYEDSLTGAHVRLPNDLTASMTNLTVDYEVWVDPANVGDHQMWSFGSKSGSCDVDTGAQGSIFASNTAPRPGLRFRVGVGSQNVMAAAPSHLLEGAWKHVTYTQSLNANGTSWTGTVYVDGVRQAQVTNLTTPPSVNVTAGTNCNFLARSQVAGHYSFRGILKDFRVYDRAVSLDEALALSDASVEAGVRADAAAIDLGLTSAIVRDIVLPKVGSVAGSSITWASSDPSVVSVYTPPATNSARKVQVTGRVTRPALGQPDATVVLTATVRKGTDSVTTRQIPVTVKAQFDDAQAVDRDTFDLDLYKTDDVRGNIDLPATGEFGSTITWTSTTDLVGPTGEVTRPAYGRPAVTGTLTATITKGSASQTKSFPVTVKPLPRWEEKERYFLGYFKGENIADGEQIMFATSNGNTALDWTGLTGGRPSLISQLGDQGLRDPHIVRSPDGDTFYMIATDLNWYDQGGYEINDTQYIEVFESHDLVNWTPQRHVKVAPENAGNAFAPESLWVEEIGAYVVFWAQSLWNDPVNRTNPGNAQMWYNITRDFQTFSEPKVWQNPFPQSRIDTTAIKVGDYYYRVTKNEAGNAGSDIFSEKHTDFLDSNINNWQLVAPALGRTTWVANQGYEGPIIFEANPGDTACPGQFYLWGDRYTNGGGYQAACEENIEAPTWDAKPITMTNAGVPRPRHGTVIPITLREWNSIRGIPNSDVATTTEVTVAPVAFEGSRPTVTATVRAADTFETGGQVRFSAGDWSQTAYLTDGKASVQLPAGLPAGASTVTAEFLGFEILDGSQGSASVRLLPPAAGLDAAVVGAVGRGDLTASLGRDLQRVIDRAQQAEQGQDPAAVQVEARALRDLLVAARTSKVSAAARSALLEQLELWLGDPTGIAEAQVRAAALLDGGQLAAGLAADLQQQLSDAARAEGSVQQTHLRSARAMLAGASPSKVSDSARAVLLPVLDALIR
ncbi:immunoglobulin-like domain-containing protein [Motilibacter aurantiacus]|uniref:immunoglobulin-like domain-containing protein n=1 Tax=Motilibacter aurantiacus TaxID=2714955 RepID=UPI00140D4C7F|nr:immunoglobulin-like domain-containing protein [Motilibacter aurantiacus]NHC46685.1 hypothetical protein [Motilibacter aurantiacus]